MDPTEELKAPQGTFENTRLAAVLRGDQRLVDVFQASLAVTLFHRKVAAVIAVMELFATPPSLRFSDELSGIFGSVHGVSSCVSSPQQRRRNPNLARRSVHCFFP